MSEKPQDYPDLIPDIEKIKQLEGIDIYAKIELILIYLGEKPTTEIRIASDMENKMYDIQNAINAIGFESHLITRNISCDESPRWVYEIKVARNRTDLTELLDTNDPRVFGKLYGFPETAIEAFARERTGEPVHLLCLEELPIEVQESPYAPFCQLAFSENWREEIKTPQRWSDVILQYAPELHATYLDRFRTGRARTKAMFEEHSQPLPEDTKEQIPNPFTIVKIESRWAQVLGNNDEIRWLDTGQNEDIDWNQYRLEKKWDSAITVAWMTTFHNFTHFELSNIYVPDKRPDDKYAASSAKVFGEYRKR